MTYSVQLTANAQRNLRQILSYLQKHSPSGAAAWYRRWLDVLHSLESVAGDCGPAAESPDHDVDLRQIVFKTRRGLPYRAIFTLRDDECLILHVRGPGQDLVSLGEMRI